MARSDLEEIAKLYIDALWLSRDLRRLHLETHTAKQFVDLVNKTVFPLKMTVAELRTFNRIVQDGFSDIRHERNRRTVRDMSPSDSGNHGTGPGANYVPPPKEPHGSKGGRKKPKP